MDIAALLFLVNALICQKLFFTEYLNQMHSIEGAFITIARDAVQNFGDVSWWPTWFCGMPYQSVYGPVFHHAVAAAAIVLRISPALAFHTVTALCYCLGPVTLFWMTWRFTGSQTCGFWAGLLYSTLSPAALVVPAIRADMGGAFYLRRLHNVVVWGEQPHVAALMLAPLALISLDAALRRSKPVFYALSAITLAFLALTNVTGIVGFCLLVSAYLLAFARSVPRISAIALLAYGLAVPWMPPSDIRLILTNSQRSAGNSYPFSPWHALYFALIAVVVVALYKLLAKAEPFLRFALLLTFFSGVIFLPAFALKIAILPQPERFQLEFEMGVCLAIAFLISKLGRAPAAVLALLCLVSIVYNRRHADELIQAIDIGKTAEYKEAIWFDQHMGGRRVFAPGSVSFWMNIFTDTPQMAGCCDQGVSHWQQKVAHYILYAGTDAEVSLLWLQAFGVHAAGMSGPGAGEWYKPFANPDKFDGALRELWREGGDVIYEVPQRSASLAHVVRPEQVVTRGPIHGLDVAPLRPFVAALNDPQAPLATMEWKSRSRAVITAGLRAGDLISAQISYHPGWRAIVNGARRKIESDAIGFQVIHPECVGACVIDLIYDGGLEMMIARAIQILAAAVCVILCLV